MSKARTAVCSSILAGSIALGCGGGPSSSGAALSPAGPAVHFFVTGREVTGAFLPEQVVVKVTGLPPGGVVTLRAAMPGHASHATFVADLEGSVDLASQAPEEGTYPGADADGLFWSMVATDATSRATGEDLDVTVDAEVSGEVVASGSLRRYAEDPGVVETPVHDEGLVAVFAAPPVAGPRPALIAFGGSEGGIDWGRRAAQHYASLGYPCLGLAYFRGPGLPARLADVPLEYFAKALSWMKRRPEVKADAIGVVGASRGGELALVLGATFPDVKAVIAHVPSGVVWPGDAPDPGSPAGPWTVGGKELAYIPPTDDAPTFTEDAEGRWIERDTPMFDATLDAATPEVIEAASTRVERVRGPVLLLAAADDQIWPSCRLGGIAMDRLVRTGHRAAFGDELVCYPDAGHIVGNPGRPTTDPAAVPISPDTWLAIGGTPAGTARAARDSFERRRAFLARALQ
jgi:dienelactone hydrolase